LTVQDGFDGFVKYVKLGGIRYKSAFHAGNTGSNPVGDAMHQANKINRLGLVLLAFFMPVVCSVFREFGGNYGGKIYKLRLLVNFFLGI